MASSEGPAEEAHQALHSNAAVHCPHWGVNHLTHARACSVVTNGIENGEESGEEEAYEHAGVERWKTKPTCKTNRRGKMENQTDLEYKHTPVSKVGKAKPT